MKKVNECTQCGWQGNDEEKVDIMQPDGMGLLTCPKCGCGEFYVEPSVKNCTIPDVSLSVCEMCGEPTELQSDNLCGKCWDKLPS